jgi:poly(3-hydroxybutyrate) depolymerase
VQTLEGSARDPARNRIVRYVAFAPLDTPGATPVILVSHGGDGSARGHLTAPHLGSTLAAGGFLAIHVGHDVSTDGRRQLDDRPADITFVLDELAAGRLALPAGFTGTPDLERVGHTGHSFGAYTSHAVAGATYDRTYRDERIDAIAPISPQGPDQFGAFVRAPGDTTWTTVTIPSFNLIGGDEIDSNAVDTIQRPGWRLAPFDNYPGTSDTFRTIIAGQGHSDMWRTGSDEVKEFIANEILQFMRRYVAGDTTIDLCDIGVGDLTYVQTERQPGGDNSQLTTCR